MKIEHRKATTAAALSSLVLTVSAIVGSTLSEGDFICISKRVMIGLGVAAGVVMRLVGLYVRNGD